MPHEPDPSAPSPVLKEAFSNSAHVLLPGCRGLPESVQRADILKYDRKRMWTAFNYVANYAMLKYSYMVEDIRVERARFEAVAFRAWGNFPPTAKLRGELSVLGPGARRPLPALQGLRRSQKKKQPRLDHQAVLKKSKALVY